MIQLADEYLPLIGETAWHSIIIDPRIADESERHYELVRGVLRGYNRVPEKDLHILEVASYAHTTGYRLARELGAQVTLFEISRHSLRLGRELGKPQGDNPRLVAGDFHALPFADGSFHFVFICSALHHTWRYAIVLRELMRVLAPGGLLFLENEPSERRMCFHKFRCNRPADFTPFERKLNELDLLRTVAEPYIGSRPESLFGMIENQTIPLADLLGVLDEQCELEGLELYPEQCMNRLEPRWIQHRGREAEVVARLLSTDLEQRCLEAEPFLTDRERGLGFALPSRQEIEALAERIAPEVAALSVNPQSAEFRYGASCLFGAPLRLAARKRESGAAFAAPAVCAERFNQSHSREDGIYLSFPEAVQALLAKTSQLPDLQSSAAEDLNVSFPPDQWTVSRSQDGVNSILNQANQACVVLPPAVSDRERLAVFRVYCNIQSEQYYELVVLHGGERIFAHAVYQPETVLVAATLSANSALPGADRLELRLVPIADSTTQCAYSLAIHYAGLFELELG